MSSAVSNGNERNRHLVNISVAKMLSAMMTLRSEEAIQSLMVLVMMIELFITVFHY